MGQQPKPIAEISRPVVPNGRYCIVTPPQSGFLVRLPDCSRCLGSLTPALSPRERAGVRGTCSGYNEPVGNSFGHLFRVTTFGESHGAAVGVVIDGCPPRVRLSAEDIQRDLDRRRPGQSSLTSPRAETDRCQILSGIFEW